MFLDDHDLVTLTVAIIFLVHADSGFARFANDIFGSHFTSQSRRLNLISEIMSAIRVSVFAETTIRKFGESVQ